MTCCITFGKFNHKYKYILYSAIFLLISDFAFGINYNGVFTEVSLITIFGINDDNFNQHYYIRQIFCYFGTFILSIILYKVEENKSSGDSIKSGKISSSSLKSNFNSNSRIQLIYENNETVYYSKFLIFELLFLILFWVIEEKFTEKLNSIFKHLDFWMLEFLFLTIFSKKYLAIEIYRHQKLAMLLTILPLTLKIVTIFLSFYDDEEKKNTDSYNRTDGIMKILYVPYPWLIPIGIIIYLSMKIMRAYIRTKIKWYMDIKYVSTTKLLMSYGIIGTIFYTIICTITTFTECSKGYKNINDYFCKLEVKDNYNEDNNKKYFANFSLYFTNVLFEHYYLEPIILFFGILGFSFYKFYSLMIIKKLTPIHLVFSLPLYYIMRKIILTISILIHDLNNGKYNYYKVKYVIDTLGDFLCIFAYLIYLEVIKLNFCNLNFNLRDNIITRGQTELSPRGLINENDDSDTSIDRGETQSSLKSND